MTIAIIAAMARNRVIGDKGRLPWRLPQDLTRFKALTMGHALVMGRATFESIGRPLPGRRTIVVTRQEGWSAADVEVVHSLDEAFARVGSDEQVFVAGGGDVYRQTVGRAARLYLTLIDREFDGDTSFPDFDRMDFHVVDREPHMDEPLPFEFVTLERMS